MDHVNLLRFHKHNYRKGKGIVGDWKNSLVNEHLDIFRGRPGSNPTWKHWAIRRFRFSTHATTRPIRS